MKAHDIERVLVLVSKRGHFSLKKAGGILGIGHDSIIPMDLDSNQSIDLVKLKNKIRETQADKKTKTNH